ncbi:MFS transporter [Corynebacterium imitans]|uniref:nitrate/nitrite transporter n=1 Tax=Corynebacterium imitans TaxID=156978 RepID=UPI00254B21A9|nr:MFS transporter [Corynebacterium imitans]MDK8305970.1 MFS transporter [Corynebacterium imitans]MDK8636925.1 MFS transporter [Corynebacterium imitans]MDK8771997.1 MFS transporter [Corynebacterium imitans]
MTTLNTSARVLHGWDPEDPEKWDSGIAWRTLWISTIALFFGFVTWYLVAAIAPRLNEAGFDLSANQLYWLTAVPGLAAGIFRLIWMFLPPVMGTRKLISFSTALFLIPLFGWFFAVQSSTPYWVLLLLAFMTGIGGGVFSGFMPSTGYFFPKSKSGTALGLQAGLSNLGMSAVLLTAPMLISTTLFGMKSLSAIHSSETGELMNIYNVALFFIPWVIVMAILAWVMLKDVPVKANFRQQIDIFGNKNTWILTIIYVMTFGALAGFGAQLALLMKDNFGESASSLMSWAFLYAMIGAVVRALWGPLCDKYGGALWTFVGGVGMTASTGVAAIFLARGGDAALPFYITMLIMSFFAGLGNAGTFKQMPMILPKRQAGGVIGFTGAVGAFGPFIVGMLLTLMAPTTFFWGCVVYFAIATILAWVYYARPNAPFPG